MWETPIYKIQHVIDNKKEVFLIDVTGSAPNFSEPGKQLEQTFDILLEGLNPLDTVILDFGAAKLRNTIYLLEKGFTIYACEFNDLFERSKQAYDFLAQAKTYKNFKQIVFPDDFFDLDVKFDVVLLINVLNVMPISQERFCVLELCRERMKENGRLLWYTQHGAYKSSDAVAKLYDGLLTGKGRKFHMFYRDFSRKEIHEMLNSTGFSFNSNFKFPFVGTNQAYVFNSDGFVLVDSSLGITNLNKAGNKKKTIEIERTARWDKEEDPDSLTEKVSYKTLIPARAVIPAEFNILDRYSKELVKLKSGPANASKYHDLIFNILKGLFDGNRLRKPVKEEPINSGRKRVDITFDNKSSTENGFFQDLKNRYNIPSPIIFIECKNYSSDLNNPEFDQISGRLNKRRGMFGIIICRKIDDRKRIVLACKDLVKENPDSEKYVIVIDDNEIAQMIKMRIENRESEIDDLLEEKFKELIL
jgi:hypothetical protein